MAVIQFKFDESYDSRIMSVGGWIANEQEWKKLESTWQRRIDFENSHASEARKITRYHATEMNCKCGEFKNWTKDMSLQLTKKLIDIIARRKMGAIVTSCDMQAIQSVFKGGDTQGKKRRAYVLCMKQVMIDVAHVVEQFFPGDTVLLVHDSGNWDEEALQGYKLLLDDENWPRHVLFEGLVSKTGKECVGLQAADMIVYEVFKGVKDKTNDPEAQMRRAMRAISSKAPVMARWINEPAAQALYEVMKDSGKYPKLDEQGVW